MPLSVTLPPHGSVLYRVSAQIVAKLTSLSTVDASVLVNGWRSNNEKALIIKKAR